MSNDSNYKLRKRIKSLEDEIKILRRYRIAFRNIFSVACDCADKNYRVTNAYILSQAKDIME